MARKKASPPSAEISEEVLSKFKSIILLTDAFCKRHLNEEYVQDVSAACNGPGSKAALAPCPRQEGSLGMRDRPNHRLGERAG